MSAARPFPQWLKWVCLFLGILLLLAALAWLGWNGYLAWTMWKLAHSKVNGVSQKIPLDKITAMAGKFIGGVIGLFVSVRLLQLATKKEGSLVEQAVAAQAGQAAVAELATPKPQRRAKSKRWTSCNILAVGAGARRLWTFNASRNGFTLNQQQAIPALQPLPAKVVGRDWRTLLQPKLNVAWLPVEQVFLRVAQLPVSDFDETLAMVELQLEKLSPLPVTQIVWSVQILPQHVDNLQTVIVIMVARDVVEKFLGELEGQGCLPHRLELPIVDELLGTHIVSDGAYIYPDNSTDKFTALVAWWYGGTLRNLGLLHVPAVDNRDVILKEQLAQMAWAGELEGWLKGGPRWHLVTNETTAATWQPMFRPWLGQSVDVLAPLSEADLATRNANRAARGESATGLLPVEYALRYTQEFHDRLWMRALGAGLMVYVAGVMIYMAGAQWQGIQADSKEQQMKGLSRQYTNTLQIKAQVDILQNRQTLKFASLDCWRTTAELLPTDITLISLDFKEGRHLSINGTAPGDANGRLTDFYEALRKATLPNGQTLFEKVELPNVRLNPGGATLAWSLSAVLANAEEIQ